MFDRGPTPDPYWDRRGRRSFLQSALVVSAIALAVVVLAGGLLVLASLIAGTGR